MVLIGGLLCLGAGVVVLATAAWPTPGGTIGPPALSTATAPATAIPVRAGGGDRCWAGVMPPAALPLGSPTPAAPRPPDAPIPQGGAITGQALIAPDDAWVVGARDQDLPFVLHWDGHAWQSRPPPAGTGRPLAVVAASPDNVWVAGRTAEHQPLLLHWTGGTWQTLPRPLGGSSMLFALAAAGADDLWMLGATEGQDVPTQVLHWTATGWTDVPQPPVPPHSSLDSLVVANGAVWVAGSYKEDISGLISSLVLRYQVGPCPAATPTAQVAALPTRPFTLPGPVPTAMALGVVAPGSHDHYIFAFRATSPNNMLVAVDYERQTEFVLQHIAGTGYEVSHIVSDGKDVAWIESHPSHLMTIQSYNLSLHRPFPVMQAPDAQTRFTGLALADDVLYYQETAFYVPGGRTYNWLFAHPLAGPVDTVVGVAGQLPVAGDGALLWQEEVPYPSPTPDPAAPPTPTLDPNGAGAPQWLPGPATCTLHLRTLDGSAPDRVIAHTDCLDNGDPGYASYAVSGDSVVWATGSPGNAAIMLYSRSSGAVRQLAALDAFTTGALLIDGPLVLWTAPPADNPGTAAALLGYRIDTERWLRLIADAGATIHPQFILDGRTVVYTLGDSYAPGPAGLFAVDVPGDR